jgi:serine/threonine protein kinase
MGSKIGRFDVLRELGRGSQSVVYLARDPHLQREVAIKTLHFSKSDPQKNQQLLSEARLVSQLRHPNIVPIFEAGEEGGDLYLVFEYVSGTNLAELIRKSGRQTPSRAIGLIVPVLDALTHAHAAGIIHRDIKPSNILVDENGTPRVMDFGIAARVETLVKNGDSFMGTPAYMAPEYIRDRESSERSDVFSLGLVLFELLTGKKAAQGRDAAAMIQYLVDNDIRVPEGGGVELD